MGETPNPAEQAAAEEFTAKIAGETIVEDDKAEVAEKAAASEVAADFFKADSDQTDLDADRENAKKIAA